MIEGFENTKKAPSMTQEEMDKAKEVLYGNIKAGMATAVTLKKGAESNEITQMLFAKAKEMEQSLVEKDALPTYINFKDKTAKEYPIKVSNFEFAGKEDNSTIKGGSIEFKVKDDTLRYNFNEQGDMTSVKVSHIEFVDQKVVEGSKSNLPAEQAQMPDKLKAVYDAIGFVNKERSSEHSGDRVDNKGAFDVYRSVADAIKANPDNKDTLNKEGQTVKDVYVTDFKNIPHKEGRDDMCQFSIKNHNNEQVDIRLSLEGNIFNATYKDWKGYDGESKTFADGCNVYTRDVSELTDKLGDFGKIIDEGLSAVKEYAESKDGFTDIPPEIEEELPFN